MGVSAQKGTLGFGPQSAKGVAPTTYLRHRATMVDLGIQDETKEGQPEVGGIAVPTFPYKTGPVGGGGFTLQPRLEDSLGWLLYGATGYVTTTPHATISGVYDHLFSLHPDDSTYVPWMSFRKEIPRNDNAVGTDLGEELTDAKVLGFGMSLPNDAPLTARVDALACNFNLEAAPRDWVWDNQFEHWDSIPVACQTGGFLTFDGEELPVVAAQVGWQNVPEDIRKERIFGSPFLESVTILQRRFVYQMTVKWRNRTLYNKILTGGTPTGTTWSSEPFTGAFEVNMLSSRVMPGTEERYSLLAHADEAMLSLTGGIVLAGNEMVMMKFQGVSLEANNGYATLRLRNQVAGYDWPVLGS